MKKIIIVFAVILVVVVAYNFMSAPVTESLTKGEAGSSGSKSETGFGSGIRKSVEGILPGGSEGSDQTLARHEEGDHVVVLNSEAQHMDVEDALEKIEALKNSVDTPALDFARWTLFSENAKYTAAEKERILEKASEVLSPAEAVSLNRDVLLVGKEPQLYENALNTLTRGKSQGETEKLVKEILKVRKDPAVKAAISEFAASKNIYIR